MESPPLMPYSVSDFSSGILLTLIKQYFLVDFNDIGDKIQINTIDSLLKLHDAQTIIREREYLDNDYFDDYSNYYVQSFKSGSMTFRVELDDHQRNGVRRRGAASLAKMV